MPMYEAERGDLEHATSVRDPETMAAAEPEHHWRSTSSGDGLRQKGRNYRRISTPRGRSLMVERASQALLLHPMADIATPKADTRIVPSADP